MDALHRILAGQTLTRRDLIFAGWFVIVWFVMDVIQFIDMIVGWFK